MKSLDMKYFIRIILILSVLALLSIWTYWYAYNGGKTLL